MMKTDILYAVITTIKESINICKPNASRTKPIFCFLMPVKTITDHAVCEIIVKMRSNPAVSVVAVLSVPPDIIRARRILIPTINMASMPP